MGKAPAIRSSAHKKKPSASGWFDRWSDVDASTQQAVIREIVVPFENGLHAGPAAIIAQTASRFQGEISIRTRDYQANGKSILELLILGATCGEHLTIEARGSDASDAMNVIAALFDSL